MDLARFYETVRANPFPGKLKQSQVDGLGTLVAAFEKAGWPVAWAAYGLATAFHETAGTMQPIAEYGKGKGKKYGTPDPKTGQTYYGRGYVQLTWLANYQKAQDELGLGLVMQPEIAMAPDAAASIMIRGMAEGWFTGKKLSDYLNGPTPDYRGARKIINGTDRDVLIAGYARTFEAALTAARYGRTKPTPAAEPAPVVAPPPTPAGAEPSRPWWAYVLHRLIGKEP